MTPIGVLYLGSKNSALLFILTRLVFILSICKIPNSKGFILQMHSRKQFIGLILKKQVLLPADNLNRHITFVMI